MDKSEVSEVCRITIRVSPPWYRAWWAYMIYGVLVLMVMGLVLLLLRRRRIAAINEAKIQLFVDFSHEMRSPLTLIKSPLASLLRTEHSADDRKLLLGIQRNTDRLLGTVNQILSIRKIESGQLMLHRKPTDMLPFVTGIADDFRYQADAMGVKLLVKGMGKEDNVFADIDRELFDKVISNLLTNAMKYVERGGEIVVTIEKAADGGMMVLRVSDSGPGIAEKEQKRVFDMFYQARSGNGVGFGIGLNFAYRIVKLHGGSIAVANREETHGAVFSVTMPTCEAVAEEENEGVVIVHEVADSGARMAEKPAMVRRSYKKRPHIIVVDDDRDVLDYLVNSLSASYKVMAFTDGQDALPEIISKVPDAVIADIKMPKMDGYTLLQRIRSNTKTIQVPVILLTSETSAEAHIEGFESGADMYVDKPFDVVELEARLAGLIVSRLRLKGKYSGAQEQQGNVQKVEMKGNDELLMERVMKVVNKYLTDETFSVEMLATEVGLSRVQLHRRMKEITGISVGDFIRNLRMQQAAELLAKGDLSVSQVAYAVGYVNPTHFATAFKKWSGMSPTEYVESVR